MNERERERGKRKGEKPHILFLFQMFHHIFLFVIVITSSTFVMLR